jgi:LmbE family N-acetylglucosaminyl deacetylase
MSRVLFIGAHPDDIELGCGATINKLATKGLKIKALTLAEGTSARYEDYETNNPEIKKAIQDRRQKSISSLKNLGVADSLFFDLPCGRLNAVPLLKINKIIESVICEFKPTQIYTHSAVDTNKDHRVVFESTRIATRPSAFPFIRNVFCYEVLSSTDNAFTNSFNPSVFIEVSTDNIQKKKESLQIYDTEMRQFPNSRSIEGIEILARYRGMQVNKAYAEAYELLRSVQ